MRESGRSARTDPPAGRADRHPSGLRPALGCDNRIGHGRERITSMNFRNLRAVCLSAGWCLALLVFLAGGGLAADVEQWGVWEASLDGPREGNPYLDVELSCTFRHEGESVTVRGFHDGDGVYKVRFSPPSQGSWSYETRSNRPELDGKTGSFTVGPPSADNHGPVEVFETFYLRYADGSPYHQFGTTCYAWVHQPERASGADAQDARRLAVQQDPLLRLPQELLHLQQERAGALRLPEGGRRQVRLQPAGPRVLAAFRAAHPRPAGAGHRGGHHPLAPLRPLGLLGDERRRGRPLPAVLHRPALGLSQRLVVAGQRVRLHDRQAARRPRRQQAVGGLGPVLLDPPEGGPAPAAARASTTAASGTTTRRTG